MDRVLTILSLLLFASFSQCYDSSYVILVPKVVRAGIDMDVSVSILRSSGAVSVTAALLLNNQSYASTNDIFNNGDHKLLTIQVPVTAVSGKYTVRVMGTGGLVFSNDTDQLTFSGKDQSTFIQTDKAIYKPGQKIQFRTFSVTPDLKPKKSAVDIVVVDNKGNRIKQYKALKSSSGVVGGELELSPYAMTGNWVVKVFEGNTVLAEKEVEVAEYVLPKYEVTVDLKPYVNDYEDIINGTVVAKYTYGKPVAGTALVTMFFPTSSRRYTATRQVTLDSNGQGEFSINREMRDRLHIYDLGLQYKVKFQANATVTELLTGIKQNGSSTVDIYKAKYKLEFLPVTSDIFKPSQPYSAYVKLTKPDGTALDTSELANKKVVFDTTIRTSWPNYNVAKDTKTVAVSSSTGVASVEYDIAVNTSSIYITATLDGYSNVWQATKSMYQPFMSRSQESVQIILHSTALKVGDNLEMEVKSSIPISKFYYQVIARGKVAKSIKVDSGLAKAQHMVSIPVTSDMAPKSRIVLQVIVEDSNKPGDEILADAIDVNVDGVFKNKVSMRFVNETSQGTIDRGQPADEMSVEVSADAASYIGLLAVDQSVLLLKGGNDIEQDQVITEIEKFDLKNTNNGGIYPGRPGIMFRRKRSIWWCCYRSDKTSSEVLKNAGFYLLTNVFIEGGAQRQFPDVLEIQPVFALAGGPEGAQGANVDRKVAGEPKSTSPLKSVDHVRKSFPETWIWHDLTTGNDGKAVVQVRVPDTLTSWYASAFALNDNSGLGIMENKEKFTVFRPFFVSLSMPYSIKRKEEFGLMATVFNYMTVDLEVELMLHATDGIQVKKFGAYKSTDPVYDLPYTLERFTVLKGDKITKTFWIVSSKIGQLPIKISARSSHAADAVERRLLVEAEGDPIESNQGELVNLPQQGTVTKTIGVPKPTVADGYVPDSKRIEVSVVGDLMGSTVEGLDKLLRRPSGCGEQNMLNFVPNIVVGKYLEVINKLTPKITEKANKNINLGYQRELSYQRDDSSFSAFGKRDKSGSMWLTAFVAKSFHAASQVNFTTVLIDPIVIANATAWVKSKQARNGSFPEPGRVIHTGMQGGASKGITLTAYVLAALIELGDRSQATTNARVLLERQVQSVTDTYALALLTYALTLANSTSSQEAYDRLIAKAKTNSDGAMYWEKDASPDKPVVSARRMIWLPPNQRTKSVDIELNAYALLILVARGDLINGNKVVKFLTSKRNKWGGYGSTQDTMLGLTALAKYAELSRSGSMNLAVNVQGTGFSHTFTTITDNNALLFQSVEVPAMNSENIDNLKITATGTGLCVIQVTTYYNLDKDESEPGVDLTVNTVQNDANTLTVTTCAIWKKEENSGMSVIELGLPSGHQANIEEIKKNDKIKLVEQETSKVVLYLDEITKTKECYAVPVTRVAPVGNIQKVPVVAYSYYESDQKAMKFYAPQTAVNVCDMSGSSLAGCKDPVVVVRPPPSGCRSYVASLILIALLSIAAHLLH